jgi:hypothetical protein
LGVTFHACTRRGSSTPSAPPPWLKAMRSFGWRAAMPPVIIEAAASAISPGKHTACSANAPTMRSWPAGRSAWTKIAAPACSGGGEEGFEARIADGHAVDVARDFNSRKL